MASSTLSKWKEAGGLRPVLFAALLSLALAFSLTPAFSQAAYGASEPAGSSSVTTLAAGTYAVSANMAVQPPVNLADWVYATNPDNPLSRQASNLTDAEKEMVTGQIPSAARTDKNATLVVGNDGTMTLTVSLVNPIFTITDFDDGTNVTVTNKQKIDIEQLTAPSGEQSYPTQRIGTATFELKDLSGSYQLTSCKEFASLFATTETMTCAQDSCTLSYGQFSHPLTLTVDLANATKTADPEPIEIAVPQAITGLTANGTEQQGVPAGTGYTLSGDYKATAAGSYTATATLDEGYRWADGTDTAKEITWTIAAAAQAGSVEKPMGQTLYYTGEEQQGVASNDAYTLSGDYKATQAGWWTATATLNPGYTWSDGTSDPVEVLWFLKVQENSTEADPNSNLSTGTWQVTANLLIPGKSNQVISGLTAYLPGDDFPPTSPARNNATLTVAEDGTKTVKINLDSVASDIFTFQVLNSSDEVEILSIERGCGEGYEDGYTPWFENDQVEQVSHADRITSVTVKLNNDSGYYTFGYSEQWPAIVGCDLSMQIDLMVDFSSAKKAYAEPTSGQEEWAQTYTDEATGIVATVKTTEASVGPKLADASFTVAQEAEGADRYTAISSELNEAYSTDDVPPFALYDIALKDAQGNDISTLGNTEVTFEFSAAAKSMMDLYQVSSESTLKYLSSTMNNTKALSTMSYNRVGQESFGTYALVTAGNGHSDPWRWVSQDYEGEGGLVATLKESVYYDWNYEKLGATEALYSLQFKSAVDTESVPGAALYKLVWQAFLFSVSPSLEVQYGPNNTAVEVSVPANSAEKMYLVIDREDGTQEKILLDTTWEGGMLTGNMLQTEVRDALGFNTPTTQYYARLNFANWLAYGFDPTLSEYGGSLSFYGTNTKNAIYLMVEHYAEVPVAAQGLVYTGTAQVGVPEAVGYTVSGGSATDAGTYTATITLDEGYAWTDGTTDPKTIEWSIAKAQATAVYTGESMALGDEPQLKVAIDGLLAGETAEGLVAKGALVLPTVAAPANLEAGETYQLTPEGGSAINYELSYAAGELRVVDMSALKAALAQSNKKLAGLRSSTDGSDIPVSQRWVTPGAMKTAENAVAAARAITAENSQAEIDKAAADLNAALDALTPKKGKLLETDPSTPTTPDDTTTPDDPAGASVEMYRLYNPNSGEHFYTASTVERDELIALGWSDEGLGWTAPETSGTPVYRLYNPYAGEHHYTVSAQERDTLVAAGWNDEGIAWYSADETGTPVYRLYNPNEFSNNHHYTTSADERDYLIALGWLDEGIAWYGL